MSTILRISIGLPAKPAGQYPGPAGAARTGGSTSPRDFFAMEARRRHERARLRRLKRGALLLGGLAVALAWYGFKASRRPAVAARVEARASLAPAPASPPPAPPAPAAPAPMSVLASAPAAGADRPEAIAGAACTGTLARHPWLAPIEDCTKAFEVAPSAAGALAVAHAHWARGAADEAGKWAARALALGTADPDAYVLLGHAERQAGHFAAALAAYGRYLRRAPHGWHAAKVRAAIGELTPATEDPPAAAE